MTNAVPQVRMRCRRRPSARRRCAALGFEPIDGWRSRDGDPVEAEATVVYVADVAQYP